MTGILIMKFILFAFVIYFVYLAIAFLIRKHRESQESKEQPVYVGGRTSPIQLNKKHPAYQKNLSEQRSKERKKSKNDDDLFDDDAYDTVRRSSSSSSSYMHHDTGSHHSDSSSDSSSDSGGGDGGGGGGGD